MLVYIPEVDKQTDIRAVEAFWITNMNPWFPSYFNRLADSPIAAEKAPRFGAWLLRSAANPERHGFRGELPTGVAPHHVLLEKSAKIADADPERMDLVAVAQPGEQPGIRRTTFIKTFIAPGIPRPQLPGIEFGLFPLDELPLGEEARIWLPDILQTAVKEGMRNPIIRERRTIEPRNIYDA